MNCPSCGAHSSKQRTVNEGQKQCTTCQCVWKMTESGASIVESGQSFLSEVPPNTEAL